MADNLNVASVSQPGDANSPINNVPTKSPLEQSTPAFSVPAMGVPAPAPSASPFPPDASAPVAQAAPPEPAPMQTMPQAEPAVGFAQPMDSAPPTSTPDMGESAPAPDTDEFLKSILQEQPQSAAPTQPEVNLTSQDSMPGENTPINPPIEEPVPMTNANAPLEVQSPNLNDKPIDQVASVPLDVPAVQEPAAPAAMPEVNFDSGQKLTDNVALDGVNTSQAPTFTPEPSQSGTNTPVSSDVFAGGEPPKSSPLKKVVLIILVLVVAAGGYYVYSTFLGGSATKKTTSTSASKSVTSSTASTSSLSLDSQRKTDLIVIQQALMDYYAGNGGKYPISANYTYLNQAGNILEKELVPTYISKLPQDPTASKMYGYKSDGITFTLTAVLDNANDPDVVMDSGKSMYEVTPTTVASSATGTSSTTGSSAVSTATVTTNSISSTGSTGATDTTQGRGSVISVPPVPGTP